MKNVYIICKDYYNFEKNQKNLGGVETYISSLVETIEKLDCSVTVVQGGKIANEISLSDKSMVKQYAVGSSVNVDKVERKLKSEISNKDDLVIYATDLIISRSVKFENAIAIQHGICWDVPRPVKRNKYITLMSRIRLDLQTQKRFDYVKTIVCVDYNFQNWYRAQVETVQKNLCVILNYTQIAKEFKKSEDYVSIIFARRLCTYRGTRVFANAIKKILAENKNVKVTVAGVGPDEKWMKETLSSYENVNFMHYESKDSLDIHKEHHIAVVPTVGSEGTSLSLLEAMSAQCAVICSDVGGMTNIILNGYNGIMVSAGDEEQLYLSIKELLNNETERKRMAMTGYETVKSVFSYERWQKQWMELIKKHLGL